VLIAVLTGFAQTASAQGRPVVAVYEMRDQANSGYADSLSTMVQTAISDTNKFRVIERNFGTLAREQESGNRGLVTTNTPGRSGGFEGADYLVYGTITNISTRQSSDLGGTIGMALLGGAVGVQSNVNCTRVIATIAVDIRIVDQRTGEVRYTDSLDEEGRSGSTCASGEGIDLSTLFRTVANKIASGLVMEIFPIQVAAVQPDGTIMLNYGEGTLSPGATLTLFARGESIRDPATGELLTDEGTAIGQVRVTEVTPRFSRAVPVAPLTATPEIGTVARLAAPVETRDARRVRR
jgi:curli biogenesis system outer membrane secretion channel CsgG